MAGVKTSAADFVANWKQGLAGAGAKYTQGIQNVTVSPGTLAANASDRYLAGVQAGLPRYKAKLSAMDLGTWQAKTLAIGPSRLASGATKGEPKMNAIAQKLLTNIDNAVRSAGPRGDLETNITRLSNFVRAMAATKGTY